jgi:hypothetical protein
MDKIKEEKLHIVADMSAREIAEGKQRQCRGSSKSYSILLDAISNMQTNSISSLSTLGAQNQANNQD